MKTVSVIATAAVLLAAASSALGADLPSRKAPLVDVPPSPS